MTNKLTRLNIISKLNFENITTTQNFANIINDNNPYTKLTWNTFSSSATMECIVSDNIKYANLSSNYNRFRTQISYFNDRSFNFIIKFRLTELRSIQNIVTINNGTTHFVCNIKNTFDNGLSLYNSNGAISINCNYKFEADIDYVISISKDEDIYKVIINGTQYLCTENISFKNNLPSSDNSYLILGCDDINPSDNINSLRGRLYWANLSIGPTMIFNGSYTKYGSSLKSFLYFGNKAINDTATSYYAPLEAIEDSIITWNGLENIDSANINQNELICTGTNSFYTNYNINNPFTLTFKYRLNEAMEDVELISYYGYKLLVTNVVNDSGIPDDPEVSVNEYTTSALNFENGLIDEIPTTVWQKEGTADITSVNKIFGDNSFETKALGDSLYTNSNIITGGSTPFTIEFYALIKNGGGYQIKSFPLFSKDNNSGGGDQVVGVDKDSGGKIYLYRDATGGGVLGDGTRIAYGKTNLNYNDINKYTITYDGASIRLFVNDKLEAIAGTLNGFKFSNSEPFRFFRTLVPSYASYSRSTYGILDNINIHDGIATKVRDPDPYEEFIVVDLAFDGENNSTKIVDNARLNERNEVKYNDNVVSLLHFDDGIIDETGFGVYSKTSGATFTTEHAFNDQAIRISNTTDNVSTSGISTWQFGGNDFCIEFFLYIDSIVSSNTTALVTKWDDNALNLSEFILYIYMGNLGLDVRKNDGSTYVQIINCEQPPINQLVHIALSRSGNTFRVFYDGVKKAEQTSVVIINAANNTPVRIGGHPPLNWKLNGRIDEIRVTKGVARYTENFTPPTEPFKYVKVNKWQVQGNAKISTNQKFDGFSSLYMPNENDYISIYNQVSLQFSQKFTISFDLLIPSEFNSDYNCIFANNESSTSLLQALTVVSNTETSVALRNTVYLFYKNTILIRSSNSINYNSINKITVLYDGISTLSLYLNGVLTTSYIDSSTVTSLDIKYIGYSLYYGSANMKGYIKNFKIYKDAAVIPEDPTGKIQLDFDNNLVDKYGNSTWTNNGVTFDQVNSVKGYSAYFNRSSSINLLLPTNQNMNFENKDFRIEMDFKASSVNQTVYVLLGTGHTSIPGAGILNLCFGTSYGLYFSKQNGLIVKTDNVLANQYYKTELKRSNNTVNLYLNNVLVSQATCNDSEAFDYSAGGGTRIGSGNWVSSGGHHGYIDNFNSYKEDLKNELIDVYSTVSSDYTKIINSRLSLTTTYLQENNFKFKDCPYMKNFKATFTIRNISGIDQIIFRTTYWNTVNASFGYCFNISDTTCGFGKGSNSSSGSWSWIVSNVIPKPAFSTNPDRTYKATVICNENNIKLYINDVLYIDQNDSTHINMGQIGFRKYGEFNSTDTSEIIDFSIWDLDDKLIYYKDFKSKIENKVDKPAVHLPLETNAINTGFTPLTVNSVGNPTYTTIDGKKCIKFEQGKYLTINSNNIFNFGTNSDFYIEFDFIIPSINTGEGANTIFHNGVAFNTAGCAYLTSLFTPTINFTYFYAPSQRVDLATTNTYILEGLNNLIFKRNGDALSIILNSVETKFNFNYNLNISQNNLILGTGNLSSLTLNSFNGYMSNFKMFVGTSEIPETYNDKKALDLDFKPTRKSYLFKDNNNKCVIHPVNITQRDYQDSQYCCTFNGVDQYLQLGKNDLFNFGNDDFIMYFVFKPTIFKNDAQIILADGSTVVNTFGRCFICIENSSTSDVEYRNKMFIGVNIGTNMYSVLASTNVPNLNAINTLTIVRSGNILKLKLNDDEWNINSNFTNSLNFNLSNNTIIGCGGYGSSYFNGYIYKIKIFRNTSDITVLNDPIITPPAPSETIYTLTDGTNTETISLTPELSDNEVTFYNKEFFIDVKVNDDNNVMSLPKNTSITDNTLTINNGFKGYIKDIKFYDTVIPFNDSDSFIDYDPYNTEFNQVQVEIINDDFTELNTLNIGNNNITGFLEGCILPISYDIIHKSTGAILTSGNTPYYSYNNIDIRYIDEYVIIDSNNKEYELINKSLDKEGFLIFILDAQSCQGNFCIRLYKHLTGKFVGEYEIINNQCQIDYLFIDERYDAVLFDRDSNIESKTLSDRIPEIKIV